MITMFLRRRMAILAAALVVCAGTPSLAQEQARDEKVETPDAAAGWPANAAQSVYLVRSTMTALHQAVETGNFTVLRDLGSPRFREESTAADLAFNFQPLKRTGVDLTATAVITPQLSTAPFLDAQKQLHLVGFFPSQPLEIDFDLTFENVANRWRVSSIAVTTAPAPKRSRPDNEAESAPPKQQP